MLGYSGGHGRSPGMKLMFAIMAAATLVVPIFMVYLMVFDRQSQSRTAQQSITQGWGGPQSIAGPVLVIPFWQDLARAIDDKKPDVTRTNRVWRELAIAPDTVSLDTTIAPERRQRSIYDAVVYQARNHGQARFVMPANLARLNVPADHLAFDRAELRFGFSDARGLSGPRPVVAAAGKRIALETGRSSADGGAGFHGFIDVASLARQPLAVDFAYTLRGSGSLALAPQAGDTEWRVASTWSSPSFQGDFLPGSRDVGKRGFRAEWSIGNLALGKPLTMVDDDRSGDAARSRAETEARMIDLGSSMPGRASIDLVTPLDLYDRINRSVKYGFLFIGFTFAAFLMFDLIGGVRVATVEYLLVGAALVLFFVMLLAFAEVIGFLAAYAVAAGAIIGLISAYSASVLRSWGRAATIGGMLVGLYTALYVLLGLEDYALLVGSLLLFAALATVMFLTRRIDWSGESGEGDAAAQTSLQ